MSIGEVINMYRDKEIRIRPEFQRLFRWPIEKQSRLIESILLDIPLPTIFVAQQDDGIWEVVDGLQRLSTILKFVGELRNEEDGSVLPPSVLVKTKYLPSLEGVEYDGTGERTFSPAMRINFKRARLDFRILLRESADSVKFEVFDRLNSGGVPTSAQEVRTAQLLMRNRDFYIWIDSLRKSDAFRECIPVTERQELEQYDLELVLRYFVLKTSSQSALRSFADMDTFLNDQSLALAADSLFNRPMQQEQFAQLFEILGSVGSDVFRKFDTVRQRPVGAFSVSAFEAVTLGVTDHLTRWLALDPSQRGEKLRRSCASLWSDTEFRSRSGAGVRASQRVPAMRGVGNRVFAV
jgi:hypothetical protein